MQIQLDPNIPTNLSPEDMRDFKSFLDTALDALTVAAGAEIFTMGNQMLGFLAIIVVVLTGLKIAFSGNIQPWELVRGRHWDLDSMGDVAVLHDHHSGYGFHLPRHDRGRWQLA